MTNSPVKNETMRSYIFKDAKRAEAFNALLGQLSPTDIFNAALKEFALYMPPYMKHNIRLECSYNRKREVTKKKIGDKVNFKIHQTEDVIKIVHRWQKKLYLPIIIESGLDRLIAACTDDKGIIDINQRFNLL